MRFLVMCVTALMAVLSVSISNYAYADDTFANGCAEFDVQVLNKADTECLFESYQRVAGNLLHLYPNTVVVPPNTSQTFSTVQGAVQGSTVIVNYQCGGRKITIESHQNYCFLMAGNVTGKVVYADPGLTAEYTSSVGSYFWSYPGHIYWAIQSKKV